MVKLTLTPNHEALRELRRVVENAPDERFCMAWVVHESDCGTARCALGWAIQDEWFIERGLHTAVPGIWYDAEGVAEFFKIEKRDADILFAGDLIQDWDDAIDLGDIDPDQKVEQAVPKSWVLRNIDRMLDGDAPLDYFHHREWFEVNVGPRKSAW